MKRCNQCELENNVGLCDRKDCYNNQYYFSSDKSTEHTFNSHCVYKIDECKICPKIRDEFNSENKYIDELSPDAEEWITNWFLEKFHDIKKSKLYQYSHRQEVPLNNKTANQGQ